ncbi:hypothetical protein PITCH_A80020 [uncultured Desulfobacterium sp.]|uniref:Uncharacterized protein n=1 Tax=uncultured Desulfobacterium sp. TaxID=201089 RepID=A0A445N2U2_9BACT|nr:hypothetical protein PITCH_A80020 [uncultured Desulfobacterium sp.]
MKKIIIFLKNNEIQEALPSVMQALFPDCEISVVSEEEDFIGNNPKQCNVSKTPGASGQGVGVCEARPF